MSDFKAEMHKIPFPLGFCPRPRWGNLQRSPDPLAVFKGAISKGYRGKTGKGRGKGMGREEERKGREMGTPPTLL